MSSTFLSLTRSTLIMGCAIAVSVIPGGAAPAAETKKGPVDTALHGKLRLRIATLSERIESFQIMSQKRLQDTGPITLTLDPKFAREQSLTVDFDKGEINFETRLLINAPLLKRHGAPATPILVSERGALKISDIKWSANRREASFTVDPFDTDSTIPVTTGPLASASARNRKHHCVDCCSYPANKTRRFSVVVNPGGTVIAATRPPAMSGLVCAVDQGVFSFSGRESEFRGARTGTTS